ncbi:hypothetical protein DMA11_15990 [Marinilabiliaceae bacterium JC017]|nr:hypothetical protein DMA11_15990 [Marinilabiliaceae bacterium JC017]
MTISGTLMSFAQETNTSILPGHIKITGGMAIQNYQNLKAAQHQLNGTGSTFELGWGKETKRSLWLVTAGMNNVNMKSSLSEYVEVKSTAIKFDIDYLRRLKEENVNWLLGAGINSNFNLLNNDRLQNDQSTYNFLNTLMLKTAVQKNFSLLGRTVQGEFSLGLGLLALGKDTKSFSFTTPQSFLEKGKYDYQGAANDADDPFMYHELMTIGNYRRIKTGLKLRFLPKSGKRHFWDVGYSWDYYSYAEVTDYRVTSGTHNLSLTYNFMFNRKK